MHYALGIAAIVVFVFAASAIDRYERGSSAARKKAFDDLGRATQRVLETTDNLTSSRPSP